MDIIKIDPKAVDLRLDVPGIYEMTKAQYHADPCIEPSLSRSCIVDMYERSPLHAAASHPRIGAAGVDDELEDEEEEADPKEMKARIIGEAADHILMGGATQYCVLPYDRFTTKEAKAARDDAKFRGEVPIKLKHWQKAERMVAAFRKRFTLERFPEMEEGFPTEGFQKVIIWQENGVWCRAMLDALGKHIWDYKSTAADANPKNWIKRQLFGMGLEFQAAWYPRGWLAATGERKHFIFAVQEQKHPFDSYPVTVDLADLSAANLRITHAIQVWKHGLETKCWDGYLTRIATAQAPIYLRKEWEEEQEREKTLAKIKEVESGERVDLRMAG